jgi:NADH pyrophosphatase NudC (nudix superfamily)
VDPAPLLVALGLAVVTVAFIARPLVDGRGREPDARERRLSSLRAEHDKTLSLLHELEMDHAMGKFEEADFQAQRAALVGQGGEQLRAIDELQGQPTASAAERRGSKSDDGLEARVAELRRRAAGFCSRCGNPLVVEDRFCSRCGQPVAESKV